jgi:UDP-3-O-[3-hydroxymyristoyl] glucosamine N-acyltransferase
MRRRRVGSDGVLGLSLPMHRRFQIALYEAWCAGPGRPRLDPARITGSGIVVRRLRGSQRQGWMKRGKSIDGWTALTQPNIDPTARLGPGVTLAADVVIGPWAVLGAGASLGARTCLGPGVVLGDGVSLGADCNLGAHVVCEAGTSIGDRVCIKAGSVVGGTGFVFLSDATGHRRVPHVGRCVVEDDVEIGANCTIDRGSVDDTVLGAGSKLDNQVHIGHNVRVGRHCLLMGGVMIGGSTRLGNGVIIGGRLRKRDGVVLGVDQAKLRAATDESLAYLFNATGYRSSPFEESVPPLST